MSLLGDEAESHAAQPFSRARGGAPVRRRPEACERALISLFSRYLNRIAVVADTMGISPEDQVPAADRISTEFRLP